MKLNATAKATLKDAGISQAAWARVNYMRDGKWSGDICGCPDSGRCANGFHHFGADDCGCLPALIEQYFEWLRGADVCMFDRESPEYVNRVVVVSAGRVVVEPASVLDVPPVERDAFAAILRDYAGLFVALGGTEVVASGTDLGDVRKVLRDKGLGADVFMRIPADREEGQLTDD